jgi:hypothetical protein
MRFPIAPVSLQASRAKKDIVTNAIRAVTKTVPFVLTGDVQSTLNGEFTNKFDTRLISLQILTRLAALQVTKE